MATSGGEEAAAAAPAPGAPATGQDTTPGWEVAVRPLLSASYSAFEMKELPQLVASVIESESEILHHEKQYEPFYSSFVALSTHYITTVCSLSEYTCSGTLGLGLGSLSLNNLLRKFCFSYSQAVHL